MSIDWITVAAQLANFLVLIWLLKRFLYRPILDGIDAREHEIADRMSEAARLGEAAERTRADHLAEIERLRGGRERVLADAHRAAELDRDALLEEARVRIEREREQVETQRAAEVARYSAELHRTGAQALLSLTRKALHDLSDETLEQRIVLHGLARAQDLAATLDGAAGPARDALVTTRDPLPAETRERIDATLSAALSGVEPRFANDPAQAPGLTLRIGGAQLGWTTDTYVDGLQALLQDGLSVSTRATARGG